MTLLTYLKRHIRLMVLMALWIAIFAGVFALYDLPVEAVAYAAGLCLLAGLGAMGLDFWRYSRVLRQLKALEKTVTISLEELPEPRDGLDREYQQLLRLLAAEMYSIRASGDADRKDMVDYYTLWAHQIKSPIAALDLLLQTGAEPAAMAAELTRIQQYVDMVLSYLRLDSQSSDLLMRPCAIDGLVRQCIRKYAKLFVLKKISLDISDTNITAVTDEKWLAFVVEQLLSNALKYTPSGGKISVYAQDGGLIIQDNGIGIRPEDLPRVFDKGYTGFNGREDKKSTGIGLYLCRRTCDMLGHGITVDSALGQGVKVRLDFPPPRLDYE